MNQSSGTKKRNKPEKPQPDFPLFPQATGRWAKKIRCQFHFFGPWRDPQGALEEYLRVKDELLAGCKPRPKNDPDAITVELAVNAFLTFKERMRDEGEIKPRTFKELNTTGVRIAAELGKTRLVSDLQPSDFAAFRTTLAKTRGPVVLGNEMQRIRSYFNWAYDEGLIKQPVRYGSSFSKPSAKTVRLAQAEVGPRDLVAKEIITLLKAANNPLKAMIYSGVNCGLGNHDVASLKPSNLDLTNGWLTYPRPKTGIARRAKLWPETMAEIKESLDIGRVNKNPDDQDFLFVTKMGNSWAKETAGNNPVSFLFKKLLIECKLYQPKIGSYSLRRTYKTIAGETLDQSSVDMVMGHVPHANDMGGAISSADWGRSTRSGCGACEEVVVCKAGEGTDQEVKKSDERGECTFVVSSHYSWIVISLTLIFAWLLWGEPQKTRLQSIHLAATS